jgi:hypothetical protein
MRGVSPLLAKGLVAHLFLVEIYDYFSRRKPRELSWIARKQVLFSYLELV